VIILWCDHSPPPPPTTTNTLLIAGRRRLRSKPVNSVIAHCHFIVYRAVPDKISRRPLAFDINNTGVRLNGIEISHACNGDVKFKTKYRRRRRCRPTAVTLSEMTENRNTTVIEPAHQDLA